MIISIRKFRKILLFFSLFILFTLLITQLVHLFSPLFPFRSPYQEPYGKAVKVSVQQIDKQEFETSSILDRMQLFYWVGE